MLKLKSSCQLTPTCRGGLNIYQAKPRGPSAAPILDCRTLTICNDKVYMQRAGGIDPNILYTGNECTCHIWQPNSGTGVRVTYLVVMFTAG